MQHIAVPIRRGSIEAGLGLAVALIGLLVLAGWALDIAALRRVLPNSVGMKANTAAAFLLCGASIAMTAAAAVPAPRRLASLLIAFLVVALGALSLAEELLSIDFGIDQFLFADSASTTRPARPGRMSPATALCFILFGVALVLFTMTERVRLQLPFAAALCASVALVGLLMLAAHVSHKLLGLRWGGAVTMAIHTAAAFVALGLAGLARARRLQRSTWALGRAGTAGFAIGIVLMLGAAELATSFVRDMEATTASVVRRQQTLRHLQEIRTELRVLESAQRGHLVLGEENFLQSRTASKAAVREHIAALGQAPPGELPRPARMSAPTSAPMSAPMSTQLSAQLSALQDAIDQRFAFGDRLIAVRRSQGFEAARALFNTGEDVALTARITAVIAPMVELERSSLAERQQHLQEVTATTFLLLPIASFLGLTALLSGLFFLDKGFAQRQRAEQALGQSRAELQVVFDSMAEGVRVIDTEHRIVQMNRAGASVHGLIEPARTLDAIMAQLDAIDASGRTLAGSEWPAPRAFRGDYVRDLPLRFQRRDSGQFVVVEINTAPVPVEPGQPAQVIVTSHDVTDRQIAETAIAESRVRLERVVENMAEGLLIRGLDGERVHWNRAALAMYEFQRHEVEGMTLEDFANLLELSMTDGTPLPIDQWPMPRLMRGEPLPKVELRLRRRDRPWERVFSFEGALLREVSGSPLVFLTVTDVSARKTAELQLQALNAELEQRVAQRTAELHAKTRELESFCYSVSHDLKAPLRGIDGYSRLLLDEYGDKLDADARMFITNVRKGTAQMNALIEDLLAYSQQERRTIAPTNIRLRPFIDEKLARRAADLARVQVSVDIDDVVIRADRDSLAMAVRNLIDNAVKFSARSQPPTLQIRSRITGDRCVLSVQDNGTGFDMRYYDKIFEIFQRLHRAEDYPGTGVGLALVRKAMERMGGRVWAESQVGQGATFHLEFELAGADADAPA
jgi:PAS domain S-box-containing protein